MVLQPARKNVARMMQTMRFMGSPFVSALLASLGWLRFLLRRRPLLRQLRLRLLHRYRLQHPDPVAFGVPDRDEVPDAGDGHWLAEHLPARARHARHRLLEVIDGDDDRGLRGPFRLLREEAAVDGAGLL